nr:polygalacturonase At1g48100 [Tanacetum cinerariifolium]
MVVPKGSIFLIKPISFAGPNCGSNIVFQLDGKIIAPKKSGSWESGLLWWIEFTKLNGITIRGSGVVDGQGSGWWSESGSKPTAIRFYGSTDVTVTGITIQNSQQTHLKFDNCQSVQVFGITVSSPGDSPNTDGIHLQNSQDVTIHSSKLACGINIENVDCGPGHGISIGSLGKDNTVACVSNITVSNTKIHDTMTGVRIKTWQGGSGSVQGVTFSNIQVSKVETPIIIDQYYCDGGNCKNDTSAVAVSGVSYQNIRGTYTQNPVRFACSDSLPCTDVTLDTIQLQQVQAGYDDSGVPFCVDAATDVKHKKHHRGARVMKETFYPTFGESRPTSFQYRKTSTIFNVRHFGAKGDGTSDDTKAFEAAWLAACKLEASTMVVPKGSIFLVKPISFSGSNCESNIVFQLDGKIIAPKKSASWPSGLRQWLEFTKLNGITIRGTGVIDGQGSGWWTTESGIKPTAVRFYGSSDVTVTGITIQNSQQTHLKFDNCESVQVFGITVSSPGDSPNTDGIHLQNSQDVSIQSSKLACGVNIQNVDCGPRHGISIGSLGKDNTVACVSNITVRDTNIHGTMTGVRIKTWQGGLGSVKGVTFANIQMSEVQTPIIIDQFYCGGSKCYSNKKSAVAVSGISYKNIRGTYTKTPVRFACSDSVPCTGVSLDTIQLQPAPYIGFGAPFCSNIYGQVKTSTTPRINCLMAAKPSKRYAQSGLGSAVVATAELSFFVGCGSEIRRGIVETIVSAMVSNTLGGGVPEVGEDLARVREYMGVVFGLNIAIRRREECIGELKALGDCEGVIETVRFIRGLQQDDMEKRDRSLLLMREIEEVGEDLARVREYMGVVFGLNIAIRRREECIGELKALGDCEGVIETVRFIRGLQQDDMEKRDRSLLLMREIEVKARDKSRFILKLSGCVVD